MARIKVDPRKTSDRLAAIVDMMKSQDKEYSYITGFFESRMAQALEMLPVGKRQQFLNDFEKAVKPKTRKVRNLMTGTELEIAYDTPMSCDPSTETYWSM